MMKNKVLNYIKENNMIDKHDVIVVGVSGGADSMCLLHILAGIRKEYQLKIVAVHIHHGIREKTADDDAEFVKNICEHWKIPVYIHRADVLKIAKNNGMSVEEAGRQVRYEAFYSVLEKESEGRNGRIGVAHNADDQAETVLHNLFRGSGAKGLVGILPVRDRIIRPILCLTREEIELYDMINNIKYVTDETNFETEYMRNRIRHNVIPLVKEQINQGVVEHINNTAKAMALINDYMSNECQRVFDVVACEKDGKLRVDAVEFGKQHDAMKWQLANKCLCSVAKKAKDISRIHLQTFIGLMNCQTGKKINLPYGMTAVKEYDTVVLSAKEEVEEISDVCARLVVGKDTYSDHIFVQNDFTKWIDCDIIKGDLCLRRRLPGDYIVVNDAGAKKKLKDFFIDKKIPRQDRDKVLLVADGNEIVWIVGYRLSSAYKVRGNTKNILKLTIDKEDTR